DGGHRADRTQAAQQIPPLHMSWPLALLSRVHDRSSRIEPIGQFRQVQPLKTPMTFSAHGPLVVTEIRTRTTLAAMRCTAASGHRAGSSRKTRDLDRPVRSTIVRSGRASCFVRNARSTRQHRTTDATRYGSRPWSDSTTAIVVRFIDRAAHVTGRVSLH